MIFCYKSFIVTLVFVTTLTAVVTSQAETMQDYSMYCTESGGVVEEMPAEFNTFSGREIGQTKLFCSFYVDNGYIAIGLETFSSERPSIAATYIKKLSEIRPDSDLWKGSILNPSHKVCKNLGGAEIGYISTGGFTNRFGESDICVFGDGSMVSSWSLIYMANHRDGFDHVKNKVKSEPLNIYVP